MQKDSITSLSRASGTIARPGEALGNVANKRTPPLQARVLDIYHRRLERFAIQRVVQRTMRGMKHVVRDRHTKELKKIPYRVVGCMWNIAPGARGVTVRKTTQGAAYSGLLVCGSVWHCPVCAARIANERRKEVYEAIVAASHKGYKPILVTLTARHNARTRLKEQLEAMTEAHESLWRGAPARRFKERYGVLGFVRNLEATHSRRNGHHPHIHSIVFVPDDVKLDEFSADLRLLWESAASKHGLTMNRHGFDATDADKRIADYLTKMGHEPSEMTLTRWKDGTGWNEADELTRWHTKKGKVERGLDDHLTPWQLLEHSAAGDEEATKLFKEYARAFHGRRQIHWSHHLRDKLGLKQEMTDQEAAEKELEGTKMLEVFLDEVQWQIILANDARAELLELVEKHDADEIRRECLEVFGFVPLITEPRSSEDCGDDHVDESHDHGGGFELLAG